ncbi:hypothetical protein ACFC0M_06030 [Streptomyces sp. NPDC056149]|uniref:hypothetical protein n=1 Tax=Streptomyces sp. NPDC056149 TaxID=3345728 RepID=UPI0035D64960
MPVPELDLRLDGFEAANAQVEEGFWHAIEINEHDLIPLAEHHSPDLANSYYVLHDPTVTWGIPGEPEIVALHLRRDLQAKTFGFEHKMLPLPAMAQSWLIHRGCPAQEIGINPKVGGTAPADEATRALERRLMGDGDRYALGYSYTSDDPDDMVIVAALRALDDSSLSPYRVLVQDVDTQAWTHTLREGGFATVGEAVAWCHDRVRGTAGPLPPVRPTTRSHYATGAPLPAPAPPPPGRIR